MKHQYIKPADRQHNNDCKTCFHFMDCGHAHAPQGIQYLCVHGLTPQGILTVLTDKLIVDLGKNRGVEPEGICARYTPIEEFRKEHTSREINRGPYHD